MGLLIPTAGEVRILGEDPAARGMALRRRVGFVPSGDRSLYLRISGRENLRFFARMQGFTRREAKARAEALLAAVSLTDAADRPVSGYSHGMQKRLSVARALLTDPDVLIIDESTHDLDPEAADRVQALVRAACDRGAAVVWTTQRLEEIRGFADAVTLLRAGRVRFAGAVPDLMEHARRRGYLLRLELPGGGPPPPGRVRATVAPHGRIDPSPDGGGGWFSLLLTHDGVLGDAIAALAADGVRVVSCTEERSALEEAFRSLTTDGGEL
jgi:ABC-2 type transport system ATP-binding protein